MFLLEEEICTEDLKSILYVIKTAINLIRYAIPIILIIMGTMDLAKVVTNGQGDEKETKAAQKKFITRIIYAVVIFLIPVIVTTLFNFIKIGNVSNVMNCYSQATSANLI